MLSRLRGLPRNAMIIVTGVFPELPHPVASEIQAEVRARCAEVMRATADRYMKQQAEADKTWRDKVHEMEETVAELQRIINNNLTAMAGGADNSADNSGPTVEEVHDADWDDPNLLDGLAAELGLNLPPVTNLPPADSSSGNRAGGGQGQQQPSRNGKSPGNDGAGGQPPPRPEVDQKSTTSPRKAKRKKGQKTRQVRTRPT